MNKQEDMVEIIDEAILKIMVTKPGTMLSAKLAKEKLPKTYRHLIADKIGKLIRQMNEKK